MVSMNQHARNLNFIVILKFIKKESKNEDFKT